VNCTLASPNPTVNLRRALGHGFALLAALAAGAAWAGPPFVTDDPEPVEAHAWEVNAAVIGERAQDGTAALLPALDINYGLLSGVQLHFQPQGAYSRTNAAGGAPAGSSEEEVDLKNRLPPGTPAASATHAYGIGDTELGIKLRLTSASESDESWMISLYPLLEIPTGDVERNLGAGAPSQYLPVWFQRTYGRLTTFGGGGYWRNHGTGSRNAWAGGWAALYQVTQDLQLGGEVYAKTSDTIGQGGHTGFNLGGNYALSKDYGLLFSAGRGLGGSVSSNQLSIYLGLRASY
jgi:hypothetical protein